MSEIIEQVKKDFELLRTRAKDAEDWETVELIDGFLRKLDRSK